jgi:hypothetical protein
LLVAEGSTVVLSSARYKAMRSPAYPDADKKRGHGPARMARVLLRKSTLLGATLVAALLAAVPAAATGVAAAGPGAQPLRDTISGIAASPLSETVEADGTVVDWWHGPAGNFGASGAPGSHVQVTETHPGGRVAMSIGVTPPVRSKTAPDPTIWDHGCSYYNGQYGVGQSCFIQYMAQNNGGGNWYLADLQTATFQSGYGLGAYSAGPELVYPNVPAAGHGGNQELTWSPQAVAPVGSCQQYSVAVNYYIQVGTTFTLCPNELIPITGPALFGAVWFGSPTHSAEGADAADVVWDPATASDAPTIYLNWAVG